MNVRVAELRVVRRRAVNSAADKHRRNCLETAHDEMISVRGFRPQLANPGKSKNRAPQDCFGGWHRIIWTIDFRPDDISYPPVQPV
jgi:hypothetical protein